ncbi:MAG: hypothetical protein JXM69_11705 [Anaerolineae bacterium]|nr:hypothetical protein [Anaerolineae bacterium]
MSLPSDTITEKISGIVDWLAQKHKHLTSTDGTDALQAEIHQLKRTLSTAPTRPMRPMRKFESLEPVTEQQKIMDMAG